MSFTRLEKILWLVSAFLEMIAPMMAKTISQMTHNGKILSRFFFSENVCYQFFLYKGIFHPGKLLLRHYKNDEIHMKGSAHFATLPHFHVPEVISTLLRPSYFSSNENFMHHFCENLSPLCVIPAKRQNVGKFSISLMPPQISSCVNACFSAHTLSSYQESEKRAGRGRKWALKK